MAASAHGGPDSEKQPLNSEPVPSSERLRAVYPQRGRAQMSDTYSETTTTSWTSRIGDSVKGVLFGIALIVLSCIGLFWNEGRAVQTAKSLAEGANLVIDVDPTRIDPINEGKLIHVSGEIKAGVKPVDAEFGV